MESVPVPEETKAPIPFEVSASAGFVVIEDDEGSSSTLTVESARRFASIISKAADCAELLAKL